MRKDIEFQPAYLIASVDLSAPPIGEVDWDHLISGKKS